MDKRYRKRDFPIRLIQRRFPSYPPRHACALGCTGLEDAILLALLPCWTPGTTPIHLTRAVWTPVSLGGLSPLSGCAALYACCTENSPAVVCAGARPKKKDTAPPGCVAT